MFGSENTSISTELKALSHKAGAKISAAIQKASDKTGVDFSYLLQQAQVESSFRSDAKAKTSSATGLYQFIDSTWLQMVHKYGDKYGLSDLADQIGSDGNVKDPATRQKILNLRNDAEICSLMAGELACENKNYLESKVGQDIGSTELYMAHFMGPGGASKFLNALRDNPTAAAADAFPQAAAANAGVFYTKSGQKKSLAEVYAFFDNKFKIESDAPVERRNSTLLSSGGQDASNAEDNVMAATVHKGFEHIYNETNNHWVRVQTSQEATLQESWTPTENLGGVSFYSQELSKGLASGFFSPIDILDLLKADYSRQSRYNS